MAKLLLFSQRHPRPAFPEKVQRLDREKFCKNRPKSSPRVKGLKHSAAYNIILYLVCTWSAKTREDLGANSGSKRARMAKVWQFKQGNPKAAFSEKVQRGHQGKFFKNRPKSSRRLKRPQTLWRKWHNPLTSTLLNCKDWRRFRRKKQLQKCPNGQVMAFFPRSPETRIFWKSAKEGPREIFQKSDKRMSSLKRPKSTLVQMALSCK